MNNLKLLRLNDNKNQTEFAKIFNLTQGTYSNYENGTTQPEISKLIEIADYYNVSLDYLVNRKFKDDLGYIEPKDFNYIKHFLELPSSTKNKIIGMSYSIEQMEM